MAALLTVGSLCTGYGGIELGLQLAGVPHHLAYVADPDAGAAAVLRRHHPDVPNLGDITAVDWAALPAVDVVTAGYPCQPFSAAGQRRGVKDERRLRPASYGGCVVTQDVLPGLPDRPRFDSRQHRIWPKFIDNGRIKHGEWLRAMAERKYVGTCRHCGQGLIPRPPVDVTSTRTDYQADCRDRTVCRWVCGIPGGRYLAGSTRLNERK